MADNLSTEKLGDVVYHHTEHGSYKVSSVENFLGQKKRVVEYLPKEQVKMDEPDRGFNRQPAHVASSPAPVKPVIQHHMKAVKQEAAKNPSPTSYAQFSEVGVPKSTILRAKAGSEVSKSSGHVPAVPRPVQKGPRGGAFTLNKHAHKDYITPSETNKSRKF